MNIPEKVELNEIYNLCPSNFESIFILGRIGKKNLNIHENM
jgi:hypothetical protein